MHWSTNRALTTIARQRHQLLDAALDDVMYRDDHTLRMDVVRALADAPPETPSENIAGDDRPGNWYRDYMRELEKHRQHIEAFRRNP